MTVKEESDRTEIYGNIIQSLRGTVKEVLGESTIDKAVKCGGQKKLKVL
jgi:hypothetical protein